MKLEEGKWYRWFHTSHATYHIGKYHNDPDGNTVRMRPWIIQTTSYTVGGCFERKYMENIVEITDLTEINKLLHDRHEDKIVTPKPERFEKIYTDLRELSDGDRNIAKTFYNNISGNNSCSVSYNYIYKYDHDKVSFTHSSTIESSLKMWGITKHVSFEDIKKELRITSKSERHIATMKFFEQLKEPERSEAIENYDESYSCVPDTITEAISHGFDWAKSKQGLKYWENIYGAMSKSEILVFGKYKIDDIVVSLTDFTSRCAGGIYKVLKRSNASALYYLSTTNSDHPDDWRFATPEEAEAFRNGIKNINDIKPKDYTEVVNCTTQEEWDFVLSKFNPKGAVKGEWNEYSDNICMVTVSLNSSYLGCFSSKDYFINNDYTILTFKEWCDKYGHTYPSLEGRYIKCLKENDWNDGKTKVGDVLKIRKSDSVGDLFIGYNCLDNSRLRDGEFELLPIDYTPEPVKEEAIPDKPTEYIAKVGDYVEVIDAFNNCFKLGDIVECIAEERFRDRIGTVQVLSPKRYRAMSNTTSNNPFGLANIMLSMTSNTKIHRDEYGNTPCSYPLTPKETHPNYSLPVPTNIILKTKSKSIKL